MSTTSQENDLCPYFPPIAFSSLLNNAFTIWFHHLAPRLWKTCMYKSLHHINFPFDLPKLWITLDVFLQRIVERYVVEPARHAIQRLFCRLRPSWPSIDRKLRFMISSSIGWQCSTYPSSVKNGGPQNQIASVPFER